MGTDELRAQTTTMRALLDELDGGTGLGVELGFINPADLELVRHVTGKVREVLDGETAELRAQTTEWVGGQAEYWKQRAREAEEANQRGRALAQRWIDDMPEDITEGVARVIFAEAGQRFLDAMDGTS